MNSSLQFDLSNEAAREERMRVLVKDQPVRVAAKGETFIKEGDTDRSLIYIVSGKVRTYVSRAKRELVFGTYGVGESFGELTFHGEPRNTSIRAVTEAEYILIPLEKILQYISECPLFAMDLLYRATTRARVITARARSLALTDSYGRLSEVLTELARNEDEDQPVVRITHQEIANQIGCTREMVTRLLRDLETGGVIETARGRIKLLRPLPEAW